MGRASARCVTWEYNISGQDSIANGAADCRVAAIRVREGSERYTMTAICLRF